MSLLSVNIKHFLARNLGTMKPKLNKIKFFKLIIIALPFIINTSVKAQGIEAMIGSGANINEAFLNSLPPDLRGDLLDGQNMEDPNIINSYWLKVGLVPSQNK